jgi:D-alanyl-D-alanine carboxypeptidase
MDLSRRTFTSGALSLALGSQAALPAFAQASPALTGAIAAIRGYGEAHRKFFNLPGLMLGVVTPGGEQTVLYFGYANADARTAITPETRFQIGSISKVMVAAVLHQFAAEGRLRLTDRLSDLMPAIPLPPGNSIQVQHMIDHVAGLPGDAPVFPADGLWTAYAPGAHWHYSNTAYEILGKLAEHLGGKPLAQLLRDRIFVPLGMNRSRGAIVGADRPLYAQGYEAADSVAVYARGVALAPAPWVDVTAGAGCVASTAADMLPFLRALADAAQGRGALGLSPEQARTFVKHAVPSETAGMSYGNGLMHVGNAGRSYLHHTGGMLSFSSSFHVDVASGVGAFASSTISAFADFRPRLLTRFAVDALTNALSGKPLPQPPPLQDQLAGPSAYLGRYWGPAGAFELRAGAPLTIVSGDQSAVLQPWDTHTFRTTHPRFRQFALMFERKAGAITAAHWGPATFVREGTAGELPPSDASLARLTGRFIDDNPWYPPATIVERGGRLWIGTEVPMTRLADSFWRVGEESWSPERASFADFIDGRPQTFVFSGVKYLRHEV